MRCKMAFEKGKQQHTVFLNQNEGEKKKCKAFGMRKRNVKKTTSTTTRQLFFRIIFCNGMCIWVFVMVRWVSFRVSCSLCHVNIKWMKMVVLSLGYLHKWRRKKEKKKITQTHTVHIAIAPNFRIGFCFEF